MAEIVYGIDLGTTFCACAAAEAGLMETASVRLDTDYSLPSAVLLSAMGSKLQAYVGRSAFERFREDAVLVEFAKRYIGRPPEDSKTWNIAGETFDPVDISALILRKIVRSIELHEQGSTGPIRAVVTHPRDFHQLQKSATAEAVSAAGIDLIETINEPEAASYTYFEPGGERTAGKYLVFDLGGGTLDIAIFDVPTKGRPLLIGGYGMSQLGGKDWDDAMLEEIFSAANEYHRGRFELSRELSLVGLTKLRQKARLWKEKQGRRTKQEEDLSCTLRNGEEVRTPVMIEYGSWERRCEPLVDQCAAAVELALGKAGIRKDQVTRVLPVGGSVRLRTVQSLLQGTFAGRVDPIDVPGHPNVDTVVAEGATRYASYLVAQSAARTTVTGTHAHARLAEIEESFPQSTLAHGINVRALVHDEDALSSLLKQNTLVPCSTHKEFQIVGDDALEVEIFEGPPGPVSPGQRPSAVLKFPPFVKTRQGERVTIHVDVLNSGRITVSAETEGGESVAGELHAGSTETGASRTHAPSRGRRLALIDVL